jgi:hypothetical protein
MTEEIKKNLELRKRIINLGYEIAGDIDHGECFYDFNMLRDFHVNLDKMKHLSLEYYSSNRDEIDSE